jgi:hypothetical protein
VAQVLNNMLEGDVGDCKALRGYRNLCRTRRGDIRVIWTRMSGNQSHEILIVKVGLRDRVYRGIIQNSQRQSQSTVADLLGIEEGRIADLPSYQWNRNINQSWYQFIYGGYLYSPLLTEEQKRVFRQLRDLHPCHRDGLHSLLVQSAPGTGKTVGAVLIACEIYHNYGWNIHLILPENLCNEVKQFTEVKQILQTHPANFFVGTLREWVESVNPDLYPPIASEEEELAALEQEARRIHVISREETLNPEDLLLYRAFVNSQNHFDPSRSLIYQEHQTRINQLQRIQPRNLINSLFSKICWLDGLNQLSRSYQACLGNSGTNLVIFDEAQDYLLDELRAVIEWLENWQTHSGNASILCLLGDMNQRIQPVDFDWGHLELNPRWYLRYNYRNTRHIIAFANIFHGMAQAANAGNRWLPAPTSPDDAFEIGEPIRILECQTEAQAFQFLKSLSERSSFSENGDERLLLRQLASQIPVICTDNIPSGYEDLPGLNYLNAQGAKGREFNACVAFRIFQGQEQPTLMEANNWYTILTRSRSRLLIVATSHDLERIGQDSFNQCQFIDNSQIDESLEWITEWANAYHLIKDRDAIINLIEENISSSNPRFFWDTYAVFRLANIEQSSLIEIENNIIEILANCNPNFLLQELSAMEAIEAIEDRVPLRCLLLRGLGKAWDAVREASLLRQVNPQEHENLIIRIAQGLEQNNQPYEAARVLCKVGQSLPNDYPFYEEINNQEGSLIWLLINATKTKLVSLMKN